MKSASLSLIPIFIFLLGNIGDALATSDAGLVTHRATLCSDRGEVALQEVGEGIRFELDLMGQGETRVITAELFVEVSGRVTDGVETAALEYRSATSEWTSEFATLRPCDRGDCPEAYYSLVASMPVVGPAAEYSRIHLRLNRQVEFPVIRQVCVQATLLGDAPSPPDRPEAGSPEAGSPDAGGPGLDAAPHFDAAQPGQPLPPPFEEASGDCSTSSGQRTPPYALLAIALFTFLRRRAPGEGRGRSSRGSPR